MSRKIKMGMVGGGQGAFIGGVHRMAAALDGQKKPYLAGRSNIKNYSASFSLSRYS